jgi:cytochrome c1
VGPLSSETPREGHRSIMVTGFVVILVLVLLTFLVIAITLGG